MSILHRIMNREHRDYVAENKYPFSDEAVMADAGGVPVPAGAFLDIILYVPSPLRAPFRLSGMEATPNGGCLLLFSDAKGNPSGTCEADPDSDSARIMFDGVDAGCVVYDYGFLGALCRRTLSGPVNFGTNLKILCGLCHVYSAPYATTALSGDENASDNGTLHLLAASGTHFTKDGTVYSLNMLGEEPAGIRPIRKISVGASEVSVEDLWMAANPNSRIKVITEAGGITLRSVKDA